MELSRLFISLPLPNEVQSYSMRYQEEWAHLPVRWIASEALHITLLFLGEISVEMIPDVCEGMHEVAESFSVPMITMNRIEVGPSLKRPRMIWMRGIGVETIHNALAKNLGERGAYRQPMKRFTTHVTLGRIKRGEFSSKVFEDVVRDVDVAFGVDCMELKESSLLPSGAEHIIMESAPFIGEEL